MDEVATLNEHSTVVAVDHQTSTEVGGERVILDLNKGVYYGLNAVGARIWGLIEEPQTVDAVIEALLEEYDVSRERCREDVFKLLHDLDEQDLIEVR